MAIAFARARYISRKAGGSAVRSAAYNAREAIRAEGTGALYYFAHRDKPEHHEVLLPEGAGESLRNASALWNAAEAAERRRDAQLAREIVLALPANAEVTIEDRIELARRFALENFVSKGLAVQLDVHAPHVGDTDSERANWHAHLLITTRRVEGEGFSAKKARDLEPEVRRVGGRAMVSEGEAWGEVWRDLQNRYFAEIGLDLRVEATGAVAQEHIGPIRMRAPEAEANARAAEIARANAAAAREPERVLEVLTRNNATFSTRDLDRHLAKHVPDREERAVIADRVLARDEVLALFDRESGEPAARFTTAAVRDQELRALADAAEVSDGRGVSVGERAKVEALQGRALRADQFEAYKHAVREGGLKIVEGRAGTGKSFTLAAVRDAHERSGHEVIGLAPTNAVAQDLRADGFGRANTVHSELFRLKNGLATWSRGSAVIVDEAAMLDSRITGELMAEAKRAGAKVILAGDDRQLASIERGGLFAELKLRHGSVAITEVTRQRQDWQREAARDLAEGRFEEALRSFAREKAITWKASQDEARAALVARWSRDAAERPDASRFVFAYTNAEVDALNGALRAVRRERGELGRDHQFETKHGLAAFAVGDRVQFTDTLKVAKIYNGNAGTITAVEPATGLIKARLDAPAGSEPREVTWSVSEFAGFRHGYAGTIYKGQGKTIDQTYLLHTHHWRQSSSYVALTRQRESAQLFVSTEAARDLRDLARQMSRTEIKAASMSYATYDELTLDQRDRVARAEQEVRSAERARDEREADARRESARAEEERRRADAEERRAEQARRDAEEKRRETEAQRSDPDASERAERAVVAAVLIAAFADATDRDSKGRGLDERSVRTAVEADGRVRQERADQQTYVDAAYRDPAQARQRLGEIVKRDGPVSAARRTEAEPSTLGELRGRVGLLSTERARLERRRAVEAAEGLAANVRRVAEAEGRAEREYRASVETQKAADAVIIPRLSERAAEAVALLAAAGTREERAAADAGMRKDPTVSEELKAFAQAFERRFGEDAVREVMRSSQDGPSFRHASVTDGDRAALREAVEAVRAISGGRLAREQVEGERLATAMSLREGRGMRM